MTASQQTSFPVRDYNLVETLNSGQAFRWFASADGWWEGVIDQRWVRLRAGAGCIEAQTSGPAKTSGRSDPGSRWDWMRHYLQVDLDLEQVLRTFPDEPRMAAAVEACRGLRLLRQDPWECLASFVLSSTKQIVQIRQVIAAMCRCFGNRIEKPDGSEPAWGFPSAEALASRTESELRSCKMGFRAKYLLETARMIAAGEVDLNAIAGMSLEPAREQLVQFPGVGRKIADCVLLFAYGFQEAFPMDVWVIKALSRWYFQSKRVPLHQLLGFASAHFGPNSGYAQQYLFHYIRTRARTASPHD